MLGAVCAAECSQLKVSIQRSTLSHLFTHGMLVMYRNHFSVWVLVPPRFVAEPESQAVIPKSSVLFRSVFEGTPPFTVKWFKDDIELITGPSCMIRLQKYSSSVELNSVGTLQSGIYSCQVSNDAGTVKSAAELLVKGWTILFFCPHHHHHSINSIFFPPFLQLLILHFPKHLTLSFHTRNIYVFICYSIQPPVCNLHSLL